MPREVVVLRWCENHPTVEAATEYTFTVMGGQPLRVDVCGDCDDSIVRPMLDLLGKGSVPEKTEPAPRGDGATCPLCSDTLANRQGLSGHLRRVHDTGIRQLQSEGVVV